MQELAQDWIEKLELAPHPEGGWFRRTYESELLITSGEFEERPALSSIYYLLESGDFSALHRLKQDEQWNFFAGSALTLHMISAEGAYSFERLSGDGLFQWTVPAGTYFGAEVNDPDTFALVGCTVAPGYEDADFEMPTRSNLLLRFPKHATLIRQLTRAERK